MKSSQVFISINHLLELLLDVHTSLRHTKNIRILLFNMNIQEQIDTLREKNIPFDEEVVNHCLSVMNDPDKKMKERTKSMNYLINYLNLISFYQS